MSAPPHHSPNGRFRNPWPGSALHGFGGFIKWMLTRSRRESAASNIPTPAPALHELPPDSSDSLSVTWVGHISFLIQFDGMNILTDPIWSKRASPVGFAEPKRLAPPGMALDALPRIDVTVLSHDHYDHLDDRTVRRLIAQFPEMSWLAPLGVGDFLRKRGVSAVRELDWRSETTVRSAEAVTALCALDSAHSERAGVMVGSHWGTFRLTDEPVGEPPVLARRSWSAAKLPVDDLWILAHGESRTLYPTL